MPIIIVSWSLVNHLCLKGFFNKILKKDYNFKRLSMWKHPMRLKNFQPMFCTKSSKFGANSALRAHLTWMGPFPDHQGPHVTSGSWTGQGHRWSHGWPRRWNDFLQLPSSYKSFLPLRPGFSCKSITSGSKKGKEDLIFFPYQPIFGFLWINT